MFDKYIIPGTNNFVSISAIKKVFMHQSMNFLESTISQAKDSNSMVRNIKNPSYNIDSAFKLALFDEANVVRYQRLFELHE